jgi:predicted nuclease of predicted toxin-antitoxin system
MSEPVRFYLDEHVPAVIADGLRRRGVDVLTTRDAGMRHAADTDQLVLATRQGRVVFTQDADFLRLHAAGTSHAGIVFARQGTAIGLIVRGLALIHKTLTAEDMKNRLEFL